MYNDLTVIIMAGGKNKALGVPKLYFSHKNKMLWEYQYNFFRHYTDNVIVSGLDTDPLENRVASLLEALKQVRTPKVLVVDICHQYLTDESIQKLLQSKKPSATLAIKSRNNLFNKAKMSFVDTDKHLDILPVQLFDTRLLQNCFHNNYSQILNKDSKDFCYLLSLYLGLVPDIIICKAIDAQKIIDKTTAKFLY